jgi:hypothetical protein
MKKLHEFETLADAQIYPVVETKMLSGDQMRIFMIMTGLYGYFKNHTSDAQMAAYDNMFGGEFNFITGHPSDVTPLFQMMIAEEETPNVDTQLTSLLGLCQSYANNTSYPYADINQTEFDAVKLAYGDVTTVNLPWNKQSALKITLNEDLYEPSNVVLLYSNNVFSNENVGRPKRLHKAGTYGIDLTGVQKAGTLHINFNIKANVTCELV